MNAVFVVVGHTDYEGSEVIRAFADRGDADAFSERLHQYQARRPSGPYIVADTPENDAEHVQYWRKLDRWKERHPGGPTAWCRDNFTVVPVPFVNSIAKPKESK